MLKLNKEQLNQIERQMFNKARDIDVCAYNCLMTDFPKEMMLDGISMYQNRDGGFGHALDPDNLNPNSTAYETYSALMYFFMTDLCSNSIEGLDVVLNKVFNYLYNRCSKWSLYEESNLNYACAQRFREEGDSLFLTAGICALTIYFLDSKRPYYKKALVIKDEVMLKLRNKDELSFEEASSLNLLFYVLRLKKIDYAEDDYLYFTGLVHNLVTKNELNESNAFDVACVDENKRDEALDLIINSLKPHGLWEASHSWGNAYPEGESAKLKWLGAITFKNLYLLKKFNRISEE